MTEKMYFLIGALILAAVLYFSGDGFYRYPCQDPDNWGLPECDPPLCLADMTCTGQVVGDQNAAP